MNVVKSFLALDLICMTTQDDQLEQKKKNTSTLSLPSLLAMLDLERGNGRWRREAPLVYICFHESKRDAIDAVAV